MESKESIFSAAVDASIVIIVTTEGDNYSNLTDAINEIMATLKLSYEIIFVIDDNLNIIYEHVKSLCNKNNKVKVLKLTRSFGQYNATIAGLEASSGNVVFVMDDAMRDHPELITKFYAKMKDGYDVVKNVKCNKAISPAYGKLAAHFNNLLEWLADSPGVFEGGIFSRRTVNNIIKLGEQRIGINEIWSLIDFPLSTLDVTSDHLNNKDEISMDFLGYIRLTINGLLSFSINPIRTTLIFGLASFSLALFFLTVFIVATLICGMRISGYYYAIVGGAVLLLLGGFQLVFFSLMAELLRRILYKSKRLPLYIIDKTIGDFK